MSLASVLAPVFVQVALVYGLLIGLIVTRALTVRAGRVDYQQAAGGDDVWPRRVAQIGRSYANQFELPVAFFALVPLALIAQKTDAVFVVLEWIYVVARLAQAAVHVTVNVVPLRGACFFVSAVVLGIAWIRFAMAVLPG